MKCIDCPPCAPILMESTRAIGYSIEAAIADIIDNSLAAHATEVNISFWPYDDSYIAILDNGIGIMPRKLTDVMRYGCSNPLSERDMNDMGRYGLGMKTASLSQCRCLTVVTYFEGNLYARRWDLDYIYTTGNWSLIDLEEEEIQNIPLVEKLKVQAKGTLIIWNKLDKIAAGEITLEQAIGDKMEIVKEHLELVFHRYLSGDGTHKVDMFLNGNKLIPFDPFFVAKSTIEMDDEKIELPGYKDKVIVRPYILPHVSKMTKLELEKYGGKDGLRKLQGFYIYRNKRLLTWGTWFRLIKMDELSKLARVRVDITNSLDDLWTLDIKKSTAYPPEIVKARLKQIVGKITNASKRTWTFRKRKEISDNILHIWNRVDTREGVRYFINQDHPLVELLNDRIDDISKKLLYKYLETIQNNLPIYALHSDIYNDTKIALDQNNVEKKRVCELAKILLFNAKDAYELNDLYTKLQIIEPFNNFISEINEMYMEVRKNG